MLVQLRAEGLGLAETAGELSPVGDVVPQAIAASTAGPLMCFIDLRALGAFGCSTCRADGLPVPDVRALGARADVVLVGKDPAGRLLRCLGRTAIAINPFRSCPLSQFDLTMMEREVQRQGRLAPKGKAVTAPLLRDAWSGGVLRAVTGAL